MMVMMGEPQVELGGDWMGRDWIWSQLTQKIESLVLDHRILLFMEGNPFVPAGGSSNTAIQILNSMNIPYETVDVLVDPDLREGVQLYSGSPGVPQLYVNGEFMGGAEAMVELYQTGELQEAIEIGMLS
jgi:monothiol glutaredoxin